MLDWQVAGVHARELDERLSEFKGRLRAQAKGFPKDELLQDMSAGLCDRVETWSRDFDCLYVIWERWSVDRHRAEESSSSPTRGAARTSVEQVRQLSLELDIDVQSFYYFAETFLGHAAESVGFLLGDEDLHSHQALCRREILPRALQQTAVGLKQHLAEYARELWGGGGHLSIVNGAEETRGDSLRLLDGTDLNKILEALQTYALGMAKFLETAIHHPALRTKKVGALGRAPNRWPLHLVGGLVAGVLLLILVVPSWTCLQASIGEVIESGEMEPPLPANCQLTVQQPSEATLSALQSRREDRGLSFERRVICAMAGSSSNRSWLDNFYVNKTLSHGRHVFLAETQDGGGGGRLFVVESCLVPRWRYLKRLAGHCETQL